MRRILLAAALLLPLPLSAQTQLVIVSGMGGEPKYVQQFRDWGVQLATAAVDRYGLPPENVVLLTEDPAADPKHIDGESRKDAVVAAIRNAAAHSGRDDRFMLVLIGHGSADSRGARINIPGPDLTAEELKSELAAFRTQPVAIVNTASASGDYVDILKGENRAIITATRSGMERNETVFGKFFVAAMAGDEADANQDGRVTLDEAYAYADREVERDYTNSGRLQLEHSRMEGNLEVAKVFALGSPRDAVPTDASPALAALYAERTRLEGEVDALRARSGQLDTADYQSQLENLLLELARTNRSIQQMESDG